MLNIYSILSLYHLSFNTKFRWMGIVIAIAVMLLLQTIGYLYHAPIQLLLLNLLFVMTLYTFLNNRKDEVIDYMISLGINQNIFNKKQLELTLWSCHSESELPTSKKTILIKFNSNNSPKQILNYIKRSYHYTEIEGELFFNEKYLYFDQGCHVLHTLKKEIKFKINNSILNEDE